MYACIKKKCLQVVVAGIFYLAVSLLILKDKLESKRETPAEKRANRDPLGLGTSEEAQCFESHFTYPEEVCLQD
jgi:hypothetical protein